MRRMANKFGKRAPLWAAALLLASAAPALADDPRAAFRSGIDLFEQGKYQEAKLEFEKFLAANPSADLALEMQQEAGYQVFVEMLASKNDEIMTIARKVLELAERGTELERQDAEKIQALIQAAFSEDAETSYRAVEELASRVGPYCVPFLVDHLADKRDNEKRVKAIVILSKLGPDGTNAVIPLLRHKDDYVRENTCHVLGHIRDFKAIPYLKAIAERNDETPHVRKAATQALKNITGKDSLEGSLVYFLALAERYYQEDPRVVMSNFKEFALWDLKDDKLAYRVVPRWIWNEKEAENACYAAIQHASKIGASGDSALDQVYTLLLSAFFQQVVEANGLCEIAEIRHATGGVDPAEVDQLKQAKEKVKALAALAAAKGEVQILKALRKALVDRRVELAVAMIDALREVRMAEALLPAEGANLASYLEEGKAPPARLERLPRVAPEPPPASQPAVEVEHKQPPREEPKSAPATQPKEEPPPAEPPKPESGPRRRRVSMGTGEGDALLAALDQPFGPLPIRTLQSGEAYGASLAVALTFEDKRVRYAAAETLLRLNPLKKFANSDKVVPNLAAAVQESGSRVVFVVAKDVHVRNRFMGEIRNMNHLPFAVESGKSGVVRARGAAGVDVILLHSELNTGGAADDFTVPEFLEQIEKDYRTAGTPVVVIVPKVDLEAKEKLYERAAAVIADDTDPVVLKEKLEALWTGEKAKPGDPKAKAVEVARRAAEALAAADPRSQVFDLRLAVPGLMQTLETQPDVVRIPALRALGNIRAREAVDKVAAIFDNTQNSKEVRIAAAYCLGEALRGQALPAKIFESLKASLKEGDAGLFAAAAEALGKTALSRDQAHDVFVEQRME